MEARSGAVGLCRCPSEPGAAVLRPGGTRVIEDREIRKLKETPKRFAPAVWAILAASSRAPHPALHREAGVCRC
jgi:hypothetical protein